MSGHKRTGRAGRGLVLLVVGLAAGGGLGYGYARHRGPGGSGTAAAPSAENEQLYTCGMHPQVIQKGPGICPICNMQLTPLKAGDGGGGGTASLERKVLYWRSSMNPNEVSDRPGKDSMGMERVPVYGKEGEPPGGHTVRIDAVTVQNMGIRTAPVRKGPLVQTIRTVGRVAYNEELLSYVTTKFEGWIETLQVNQTGQYVQKGDPLFDVYSRDLYLAQEELLTALRSVAATSAPTVRDHAGSLVEAARKKLRFFDISDQQIDALVASRQARKALTIYSPASGIVTEKDAVAGKFIEPGMKVYTIADLSRVWVYVSIYEYQLPWIRVGQSATMRLPYIPGKEFTGKVIYIYPYLEEQTRVIRVRLEFENPALELKPEMYANVTLRSEMDREALLIPREAYIDSGLRKVAFVDAGGGKFEPRELQVGVEAEDGMVEVLRGLDPGDVVVTSGQFLLDSESKLQEAVEKMREPPAGPAESPPAPPDGGGGPQPAETHRH
jgi:Cu(I)/Ag(I) efflux system membrane fusion protein/cobalt-zinc-cadmium efflux system membrane fusion protein